MEPVATISGLATGIDFRGLVDQIMEAESRPLRQLQTQIERVGVRAAAWEDFRQRITDLRAAAQSLSNGSSFEHFTSSVASATGVAPFSVSAGSGAQPGRFDVEVLQLATREKVGSDFFGSRSEALGLTGEFLIGGQVVSVGADDSLESIAAQVNLAGAGTNSAGVSASVVETTPGEYRLMFTAGAEGSAGVNMTDGSDGVLRGLGFMGAATSIKHTTSDGALSDLFDSSAEPLGDLIAFSSVPAAGAVFIGSVSVTLDLGAMSLDDIANEINTQAGVGSGVRADVVVETAADGTALRRLDISGATSFTDSGGMLEALGVVTGDRGAVAQQVGSNAFTDGNGTQIADAATSLTSLFVGGEDAGVQVGDTFSITGTRGDGSEFTATYTVAAGEDLQDVLDVLNSDVDGFQAGESTATASIDASGQLVVTDDESGGSLLNLQIVSNNEGGGRLDFGEFQAIETGRSREVVDGADARLAVDGNFLTRSSNSVSDVIDGVTLDLLSTTEGAVSASVERDSTLVLEEVQAFVDAYNEISAFVGGQFSGAGAEEEGVNAPLSGDSTVLQMRNFLRDAMNTLIDPAVGDLRGLFAVGIEIDSEGVFTLNEATLTQALADDPVAVERLFNEYGTGSVATLSLVSASDSVGVGNYDVEITQAASRAFVEGLGFGGSYVDDATADLLKIVDTGSGAEYEVALSASMSMEDIVQAINAEFGTKKQHQVQNDAAFYSDAVGTVADASTALADLFDVGGLNQGVADGDVITLSGMTPDGISTFTQFTVTDAATQTLGDLQQTLADSMSGQVDVAIDAGAFTVANQVAGQSFLNVQISSDNAGGGSLSFGTFADTVAGRGLADVTASEVGGELRLAHDFYGSGNGIEVSFEAGGADGSGSLGLAPGSYSGTDVQGTIDGFAATGSGEVLRGDDGTGVDGLSLSYVGSDTGAIGTLTYSRGVGAAMERATDILLSGEAGSIDEVVSTLDLQIDTLNDRVVDMELRLDRRRDALILRFARLEEAVAVAQSQGDFLASQLANLSAQLGQ